MLLGLGLVGHKLELDGIVTPDLGESDFEVCKSVAPVRASIENTQVQLRLRKPRLTAPLPRFQAMGSRPLEIDGLGDC
jgi:hypothetical protein